MAREQGAETIDFNREDPVKALRERPAGSDRIASSTPSEWTRTTAQPRPRRAAQGEKKKGEFEEEREQAAGGAGRQGELGRGHALSQAVHRAVELSRTLGTLSIIGVYNENSHFPIGKAMEKNLSINMGNCNHRRYIRGSPSSAGTARQFDPARILDEPRGAERRDRRVRGVRSKRRERGWIKVELVPAA